MKRRPIVLSGLAAPLLPVRALAQRRVYRIAWPASVPIMQWPPYAVFVDAMRERGWIEGTHYVVDTASYDGRAERIPAAVAELMARQPDLFIGSGSPTMRPLMQATKTIPIVMFTVGDPLGQGFVTSLARPGGNVTGLSSVDHGLLAKQFELLLQTAPQVRRVGVVYNPDIPLHLPGLRDVETVALRQGVQVRALAMRTPGEIDATFDALQRRWPTALADVSHVRAGILVGYGYRNEDLLRRLPHFVIRILEGTPPGEMAVEQPTRFYTALNLTTAKALGLTLTQSLLLRADELIE